MTQILPEVPPEVPAGTFPTELFTAELFTAIDHVGVAVPDLDAAIGYYRDILGMRLAHRETNVEQGVVEAMMAVGESGGHVQLLAPLGPDSPIGRFLDRSGPGLQQVAFRVGNLAAAMRLLSDRGVRLLYPEPRRGTAGSLVNFIHPKDAGGVLIELVQAAPGDGAGAVGTAHRSPGGAVAAG